MAAQEFARAERPVVDIVQANNISLMPRFWVLTYHARREIVLVIRGTMSLNELAGDLTCDPADFHIHLSETSSSPDQQEDELDALDLQLANIPGSFPLDLSTPPSPVAATRRHLHSRQPSGTSTFSNADNTYEVHGGILKMAQAMGNRGKPVHAAVRHALKQNDGYSKHDPLV